MKNFLKGKIKNKFIVSIVLIIGIIIWSQWYISHSGVDTNSYVVLIKWEVSLNENTLWLDERKMLAVWDEIITKKDSICVIEWGDGSLTRLWENWKIIITELNVEEDLWKINLQFTLSKWKTWSNVVSFLWEKSYFKQNFEDIEASVRGTVFDVNLEKDYVYVANHEVTVKKWDNEKVISENKAFSISEFSFIEIIKFISEIKDRSWEKVNKDFDTKFINDLKKDISSKIDLDKIDSLLEENSEYSALLEQYQKINFVEASDDKLFAIKNKIKRQLINLAWEEDKKSLIQYSIYDLKDAVDVKNIDAIKGTISLIWENKDIVKNLNIDVLSDINIIPEWLEWALEWHLNTAKELFKNTPKFNLNIDELQWKANVILDEAKWFAEGLLNKIKK